MITYKRHRFPPAIISYAVWLYHRFNLSHRDIEDLLAERGIAVSYEAIRLWCAKFGPEFTKGLRCGELLTKTVRWSMYFCSHAGTAMRLSYSSSA